MLLLSSTVPRIPPSFFHNFHSWLTAFLSSIPSLFILGDFNACIYDPSNTPGLWDSLASRHLNMYLPRLLPRPRHHQPLHASMISKCMPVTLTTPLPGSRAPPLQKFNSIKTHYPLIPLLFMHILPSQDVGSSSSSTNSHYICSLAYILAPLPLLHVSSSLGSLTILAESKALPALCQPLCIAHWLEKNIQP